MRKQLMSAEVKQLKHLETLRETYQRNVAHYERTAAKYAGEDNLPLHMIHDLRANREELAKVESELVRLTGEPVVYLPPPAPAPQPAPPKIRIVTPMQRVELATLLLKCQTMRNLGSRNTIVNLLEDISQSIIRDNSPNTDGVNIVNGCLDHANGIAMLLDIMRMFERNSLPMQQVDAFWQSLQA